MEKFLRNPLFKGLSKKEIKELLSIAIRREYAPGEVIVEEGAPSDEMFIIEEGMTRVVKKLPGGGERELTSLSTGALFGEVGFIDGLPRSASVVAITPTKVLVFSRRRIKNFFKKNPILFAHFMENIAKVIGAKLRGADEHIRDLLIWESLR